MQHRLRHTPHVGALPINRKKGWSPSNAEITTAYGDLTTPLSTDQLKLLDTFVTSLKTGLSITNLSDAFDVMYILANETEEAGLRNLVKDAHHATNVHDAAFTALEGFTGDGANDYLDTNYNLSTQGVNYKQNDASVFAYLRQATATQAKMLFGCTDATNYTYLQLRPSMFTRIRINDDTNITFVSGADVKGYYFVQRTAVDADEVFLDNVSKATGAHNSTGLPNNNLILLGYTAGGYYYDGQISFAGAGKALTLSQRTALMNAIEAYMDANEKGIL